MNNASLTLTIGSSILRVVPAVHYRFFFAATMREICACPDTRPGAVAVELGPEAAAAAAQWIRELRTGMHAFPVMLGLLSKNRVIRASLREKALRLQEKTGLDLSELSPELLLRELDFHSHSLLPLSPTDSIIEGIRSAVEYGLPVYGIDLENSAEEEKGSPLLLPKQVESMTGGFLDDCIGIAAQLRHGESFHRREFAMAARLKTLLRDHKSVLFTCGMSHWQRISALLSRPDIRPAVIPHQDGCASGRCQKVIIEPQIAVRFMDLFPAIARAWEDHRNSETAAFPDPDELFRSIMTRAGKAYFSGVSGFATLPGNSVRSPDSFRAFENYLRNLAMLQHSRVPDLVLTLTAAREMVNEELVNALAQAFMEYPWARPADAPRALYNVIIDTGRADGTLVLRNAPGGQTQYVRPIKPAGPPVLLPEAGNGTANSGKTVSDSANSFSWLPWDRLVTAASIRAATSAFRKKGLQPAPLTGSMQEGLDIRATLRSRSRGEAKLYVREQTLEPTTPEDRLDAFPLVWVFTNASHASDDWTILTFHNSHLRPHARDQQVFDRKVGSTSMISTVGYAHREHHSSHPLVTADVFSGMTVFHPTCFSNRQQALWLERTGYGSAPLLANTTFGDLASLFRERYAVNLREHAWSTSLILCAIPFAAAAVTVVAPDGYRLEEIVPRMARRFRIALRMTRLGQFNEKERARLSRCHLAPCLTLEPVCRFSEDVEKTIGERQTDYINMLPREVREFGMPA